MKQNRFEEENEARWQETRLLVELAEKGRWSSEMERLPTLHRQLCADLSLAQHRMYGSRLCARLNDLVLRSRDALSRSIPGGGDRSTGNVWKSFPRAVRREWRLVLLNMLLFWVPFFAFIAAAHHNERWIFAVLDEGTMSGLDEMYGQSAGGMLTRGSHGQDFGMFGFYIYNNISIGLRTIAGGVLATVGAVLSVALQGIVLGASFGYVHYAGNTERFYPFVAGHSSFELMGLVLCGVAGTRLGMAVIHPGVLSRTEALKMTARRALPIIYGGPILILLAAFVEGFWSASAAPAQLKITVGAVLWILLTAYLSLAGRGGQHEG
ncbi:MAG: stage II sporulation protein M [Verrucomicrobiaceae bacterium]|nr:MAG: stage II sporulation protein M [Verrucomicrobiaceae bacterium]